MAAATHARRVQWRRCLPQWALGTMEQRYMQVLGPPSSSDPPSISTISIVVITENTKFVQM
jgi:hypothetical protein